MVEVFVDQVGVFLQEVGVQHLHDETDGVSVQLSAQELWKPLWSCGSQQLGAGCHVPATARYVQSLAELVGVARLEVDGGALSSAAALWVRNG